MAINKLRGLRAEMVIVDEWLSRPGDHLCTLPGPNRLHYIQPQHTTCYEEDWANATPEQKAEWREIARKSMERYKNDG